MIFWKNLIVKAKSRLVDDSIKKHILAWDPDFTKVTPKEREQIDKAETEIANGEFVSEEEVWGND